MCSPSPWGKTATTTSTTRRAPKILGDIVISVPKAMEQAKTYGHSLEREIGFLTAHSMLHLLGLRPRGRGPGPGCVCGKRRSRSCGSWACPPAPATPPISMSERTPPPRRPLLHSFADAFRGIGACLRSERNMRIHLVACVYLLFFASRLSLSRGEMACLVLAAGRGAGRRVPKHRPGEAVRLQPAQPQPVHRPCQGHRGGRGAPGRRGGPLGGGDRPGPAGALGAFPGHGAKPVAAGGPWPCPWPRRRVLSSWDLPGPRKGLTACAGKNKMETKAGRRRSTAVPSCAVWKGRGPLWNPCPKSAPRSSPL